MSDAPADPFDLYERILARGRFLDQLEPLDPLDAAFEKGLGLLPKPVRAWSGCPASARDERLGDIGPGCLGLGDAGHREIGVVPHANFREFCASFPVPRIEAPVGPGARQVLTTMDQRRAR